MKNNKEILNEVRQMKNLMEYMDGNYVNDLTNDMLNEPESNEIDRGHTMALDYISKIRKDFKLNNFTDEEVESFVSYIKGELGL